MIRSPGTKRRCPYPVPEEVLLKMGLLGLKLVWRNDAACWQVHWADGRQFLSVSLTMDPDWESVLTYVADTVSKSKFPSGWTATQHVDTMPIEAASIVEENFNEQ
jgi:hypothetical protein